MKESDMLEQLMLIMEMVKRLHTHRMDFFDLSRSEFGVLASIAHKEKDCGGSCTTVSNLSKKFKISPSAISQTINILDDKGLVQRTMDKKDRRIVRIATTEAGRKSLDEGKRLVEEMLLQVIDKLGEEDTKTLVRLFKKLYAVLQEMDQEDTLAFS